MAKDDDRAPVSGRPQIQRLYEGTPDVADIGGMTREQRAAKYRRDMQAQFDAELLAARSEGVAKYRERPGAWPDGIDSIYDRWFVDDHWAPAVDGRCEFNGPMDWFETKRPDVEAVKAADERAAAKRAARLGMARAALGGVEAKLGVKPFGAPPVTKQALVDNKAMVDATKSLTDATKSATESRMGRPKKEHALTPTERARLARERKKPKGENP